MDDAIPSEGFDAALTLTDPLDHLPANKRRELARVLEIIFFEVEQFRATKLSMKKLDAKILKVILYGSYARGDWMEDRLSGYRSDYDLLIVVNKQSFVDEEELWLALDERLIQEQIAHRIKTPVLPVVHSLHDVNDQLARGRPFFVESLAMDACSMSSPAIRWRRRGPCRRKKNTKRPSGISINGSSCRRRRCKSHLTALRMVSGVTAHSCCTRQLSALITACF
jgi:predicted nucleotidyltransferase